CWISTVSPFSNPFIWIRGATKFEIKELHIGVWLPSQKKYLKERPKKRGQEPTTRFKKGPGKKAVKELLPALIGHRLTRQLSARHSEHDWEHGLYDLSSAAPITNVMLSRLRHTMPTCVERS